MSKFLLSILFLFAVMMTLSFAASCAEKSYSTSCAKCTFDTSGKMNKNCYEKYQGSGITCLFAAYPLESIEYKMGNCPGVDTCVDRLDTCKALYSSGNDALDCDSGALDNCFRQSDICVQMAVKDCSKPPPEQPAFDAPSPALCDGIFFMAIPLAFAFVWKPSGKKK